MPRNMFKQCLWAESVGCSAARVASAAPVLPAEVTTAAIVCAASAFVAADAEGLEPGAEVIIQGLMKLPAFNGLHGVVQCLDEESGRYSVLLASMDGSTKLAKVKGENLRLAVPPAPCFAPTIVTEDGCEWSRDELPSFPPTPCWEDRDLFHRI